MKDIYYEIFHHVTALTIGLLFDGKRVNHVRIVPILMKRICCFLRNRASVRDSVKLVKPEFVMLLWLRGRQELISQRKFIFILYVSVVAVLVDSVLSTTHAFSFTLITHISDS